MPCKLDHCNHIKFFKRLLIYISTLIRRIFFITKHYNPVRLDAGQPCPSPRKNYSHRFQNLPFIPKLLNFKRIFAPGSNRFLTSFGITCCLSGVKGRDLQGCNKFRGAGGQLSFRPLLSQYDTLFRMN